jgi:O-antigen biosynthesis protein WbqV
MAIHVAARIFPIVRAVAVLSMSLLVLDYIILSPNFYGSFFFGKITIVLYFVIQTVFLSGSRIAYRYLHDARTQRNARNDSASPTLILGRAADVDVSLRAIEKRRHQEKSGLWACCRPRIPINA